MANLKYTDAANKTPDHSPLDTDVIGLVDPTASGDAMMQGCALQQLKDYINDESIAIGQFQEGDNAETLTQISGALSTPDILVRPRSADNTKSFNWQQGMQTFKNANGKQPTFTFLVAGATPTFDNASFQISGRPIINPKFSYDGLTWTDFDTVNLDGSQNLIFSHTSPFTQSVVQISLLEPWTHKRIRNKLLTDWTTNAWVSRTDSDIAYGGADWVVETIPADVDAWSRNVPEQELFGFKIAHPDFVSDTRYSMVMISSEHTAELVGMSGLAECVDLLLDAQDGGTAQQQEAYDLLRYFDVYVYPYVNSWVTLSSYDNYEGQAAGALYNYGNNWDTPNAIIHLPLRNAIELDIDVTGSPVAEVSVSWHGHTAAWLSGHYYQSVTNVDPNGDGTRPESYGSLIEEIVPTAVTATTDNSGSIREYGRVNWGSTIGLTMEAGAWAELSASEVNEFAYSYIHMVNGMVNANQTNVSPPIIINIVEDGFSVDGNLNGAPPDTTTFGSEVWAVAANNDLHFAKSGGDLHSGVNGNWGAHIECGQVAKNVECSITNPVPTGGPATMLICCREETGSQYIALNLQRQTNGNMNATLEIVSGTPQETSSVLINATGTGTFIIADDGGTNISAWEKSDKAGTLMTLTLGADGDWTGASKSTPGVRKESNEENVGDFRWHDFKVQDYAP